MLKTDVTRLKSYLTAEILATHYGFTLPKGDNKNIKSPFPDHDDKNPSFTVKLSPFLYHCKSTDRKGDAFNFIAEMEGLDLDSNFNNVLETAAMITGHPLDFFSEEPTGKGFEAKTEDPDYKMFEDYCKEKNIKATKEMMSRAGIVLMEGNNKKKVLHIPMRDGKGQIIGYQSLTKFMKAQSKIGLFFNPDDIDFSKEILVLEGVSDYLTILAEGVKNVVAVASITLRIQKDGLDPISVFSKRCRSNMRLCVDRDQFDKDGSLKKADNGGFSGTKYAIHVKSKLPKAKIVFAPSPFSDVRDAISQLGGKKVVDHLFEDSNLETIISLTRSMEEEYSFSDPKHIADEIVKRERIACYSIGGRRAEYLICEKENNVWKPLNELELEAKIIHFVEDVMGQTHKPKDINSVKNYIGSIGIDGGQKIKQNLYSQESDHTVVNFRNGQLSLKTGKLTPHEPEDFVVSPLDRDFKRGADTSLAKKFIKSVCQNEDEEMFLQEWMGYCLLYSARYQHFLWIYGAGGDGKSKFMTAIENMVGIENVLVSSFSDLDKNQFQSSALRGKRVLMNKDSAADSLEGSTFKSITGAESITIEWKGNPVKDNLVPACTTMAAANKLPHIANVDEWLRRRIIIFHFAKSFTKTGTQDDALVDAFINDVEGNTAFALEGAKRLIERDRFIIPKRCQEDADRFIMRHDNVASFIYEFVAVKSKTTSPVAFTMSTVYGFFREHCMNEGVAPRFVPQKKNFLDRIPAFENAGFSIEYKNGVDHMVLAANPDKETIPTDGFEWQG